MLCAAAGITVARLVAATPSGVMPPVLERLLRASYVALVALVVLDPPAAFPAGAGLDASWTIALARASAAHLAFGRDIVFSYGPLGYLVTGFAATGTFASMMMLQVAVSLPIACAAIEASRDAPSPYVRAVVLAGVPLVLANSSIEIWPPYLILLTFVAAAKRARIESVTMLCCGLFAGVFALTKFTVAIDIGLVAFVFFTAKALAVRSDVARLSEVAAAALAFGYGALAASLLKSLEIDAGPIAAWAIETVAIAVFALVLFRVNDRRRTAGAVVAFAALATIALLSTTYRAYVWTSLAVAQGYSAALSLDGPVWQVQSALFWLAALAFAAWSMRRSSAAPVAYALLVYAWTMFKLGFVRHDLHVLYFYTGAAFAGVTMLAIAVTRRNAIVTGVVLAAALVSCSVELHSAGAAPMFAPLLPLSVEGHVGLLAHMLKREADIDDGDRRNIASDALPGDIVRAVAGRPVDVVPTETDYAFANDLHWAPEPVFQSVLATTPALDDIDERSLERRRGDAILLSFGSIDGRFPVGDEPATFRYVLCHFAPYEDAQRTSGYPPVLLRVRASRCGATTSGDVATAPWGRPMAIPQLAGRLTFARVWIEPNVAGKALTFAFRAPLTYLTLRYDDGTVSRYRLVTANGPQGLLVAPAARDAVELIALFSGGNAARAVSLQFDGDERWFETPRIAFDTETFTP